MQTGDTLDRATEQEEFARQSALVTSKRPTGPQPTGKCLWCFDPVASHVRWCCAGCRDDWEDADYRMRLNRAN